VVEFCGDGLVNTPDPNLPPEECDPCTDPNAAPCPSAGTESAACNSDCTDSECGDFKVNLAAGEQCDDGKQCDAASPAPLIGEDCTINADCLGGACVQQNGDGCSNSCTSEGCQNGIWDTGEDCDPNVNFGETDTCDGDCTDVICGDSYLNLTAGEECDDGNTANGDGCDDACRDELCGNGVLGIALGEECDDANTCPDDGCTTLCDLDPDTDATLPPGDACGAFLIDPNGDECGIAGCGVSTYTAPDKARLLLKTRATTGLSQIKLKGQFNPRYGLVCTDDQSTPCVDAGDCTTGPCGLPDPSKSGMHIKVKNDQTVIYEVCVVGGDENPDSSGEYLQRADAPRCGDRRDGWRVKDSALGVTYTYSNKSGLIPRPDGGDISAGTCTASARGLQAIKLQISPTKGYYKYQVKVKDATLLNTVPTSPAGVIGTLQAEVALGACTSYAAPSVSAEGAVGQCADAQFKRDCGTGVVPPSVCKVSSGGAKINCK
jgi:cysteine-rich repeat protein